MDENNEELDQEKKIDTRVWKKIFSIVLKKKGHFIGMLIAVFCLACLDVLWPRIDARVMEVFFGDNPQFNKMWLYIGVYAVASIMYMFTVFFFIHLAGYVEACVGHEIRKEAFVKLQKLPFSYYDKTPAGWIMARLTSDSRKLSEIISWGLVDLFWGSFTMVGILIMLFTTEWRLTFIVIISMPVLYIVCALFRKLILKAYRSVRKTNSKLTGAFNESFMGAKTTKTLCLEDSRNEEFNKLNVSLRDSSVKAIIRSSVFWPVVLLVGYIAVSATIKIGTDAVIGSVFGITITSEVLFLFINYTTMFYDPITSISRVLSDMQQAQASAERIIELINTPEDIVDTPEVIEKYGTIFKPKPENYEELHGDIEFKNVNFSYIQNEQVLKNFSLNIKQGSSIALVGHTGSGKSTIVNLLCRFYEPTSGNILIDGRDYRERSLGWLHANLGYVLQTPHLFNGTIAENIAYGKKDATISEIVGAAKRAQAYEFIMKLPQKFETNVGENGEKLSLGQRQLISFARAIIVNPKILILDEATSSIDTETEYKIQDVMQEMMKGRTSIVVAHRLSTIVNSDVIVYIENGEIAEMGNHQELLAKKGLYYELYKKQFINEAMENSVK